MGKILTIEIPDELYIALKEISGDKTEEEIGRKIFQIVKQFVEAYSERLNDPIFKPIAAERSGLSDVSERHDKYLYGS